MATGVVVMLFGIVFHLQGQGVVGPEQSFMYHSDDWSWYGLAIAVSGGILACLSGIRTLRQRGQRAL